MIIDVPGKTEIKSGKTDLSTNTTLLVAMIDRLLLWSLQKNVTDMVNWRERNFEG